MLTTTMRAPAKAKAEKKPEKEFPHLIAVYGTLRRKFHNHPLFHYTGYETIGDGKTKNLHTLAVHGLPYLFKSPETSQIRVEVYGVNDRGLDRLDQLEGHPRWYRREEIPIVLDDGKEITAWLYFMNGGFPDENHIEKSGDFEKARGY